MKAWHFTIAAKRLAHGDGRKVVAGETIKVSGSLSMCVNGLHASARLMDALKYAPGPWLWRVNVGGEIVSDGDKVCAAERTALWGFDATDILRLFACMCAMDVIDKWDAPEIVRLYLRSRDESLRSAAGSAARSAAWSAARSAARSAAESAALSAAWSAAESVAWSAAWSAAESVAEPAAESVAESAAWSAPRSAAWSAARSAAESAHNRRLTRLVINYAKQAGLMP